MEKFRFYFFLFFIVAFSRLRRYSVSKIDENFCNLQENHGTSKTVPKKKSKVNDELKLKVGSLLNCKILFINNIYKNMRIKICNAITYKRLYEPYKITLK